MDQLQIKDLEILPIMVFFLVRRIGAKVYRFHNLILWYDQGGYRLGLTASVHYGELCQQWTSWFQESTEDLIETVAYKLVERYLWDLSSCPRVKLELKKPWAPVHLPIDTCSVTIHRRKATSLYRLGSNMGDKQDKLGTSHWKHESSWYPYSQRVQCLNPVEPWGGVEQDSFANQVVEVETWLPAPVLLETLLAIESEMGRVGSALGTSFDWFGLALCGGPGPLYRWPYLATSLYRRTFFVLESLQELRLIYPSYIKATCPSLYDALKK